MGLAGEAKNCLLVGIGKKELEVLKSETPDVAGQTWAVEVVPYETLWELLNAKM